MRDAEKRRTYFREWQRKRRLTHKDHINQKRREAFAADPETRRKAYAYHRIWVSQNKKRVKEYYAMWKEKNREIERYKKIAKKFGIDPEVYLEMLRNQDHVCAICKKPEKARNHLSGKIRYLAIDHDHKTGAIRGLLCSRCNLTVGGVEDSIDLLLSIIAYLKNVKATVPHTNKGKIATALSANTPAAPPAPLATPVSS